MVLLALTEPLRGWVAWIVPEMVTTALREAVRALGWRFMRTIRVMIAMTIEAKMISILYLGGGVGFTCDHDIHGSVYQGYQCFMGDV